MKNKIKTFFTKREQIYSIEHKHTNWNYAENQEEYMTLCVHKVFNDKQGRIVTVFKMNFFERIRTFFSGEIFIMLLTFNQPLTPISVYSKDPVPNLYLPVNHFKVILENEEVIITEVKVGQIVTVKGLEAVVKGFKGLNTIVCKTENSEIVANRTKTSIELKIEDILKNKVK